MNTVYSTPSCIALTAGLAPHAEPFRLDALSGADSLLGECDTDSSAFPDLAQCVLPNSHTVSEKTEYAKARVLWAAPAHDGDEVVRKATYCAGENFSVPAPTYLAGTVDSTFSVAWKLAEDDMLPPWGAVLAQQQKEGRGQMRRAWHSPAGNLYVTFRLPDDPALFSAPASLVVGYLLALSLRDMGFPLLIKWPNDLFSVAQKKVGGILLEERGGILLAGVGINIKYLPDAGMLRKDAAATAGALAPTVSPDKAPVPAPFFLWQALVGRSVVAYKHDVAHRNFSELIPRLDPYLAWKGQQVVLADSDGTRLTGRYEQLSSDGGLVLRTPEGQLRELHSGSMSRI